jgi:hypothetical protein
MKKHIINLLIGFIILSSIAALLKISHLRFGFLFQIVGFFYVIVYLIYILYLNNKKE